LKFFTIFAIPATIIFSCRKKFDFVEIKNLDTDSLHFEGTVAAPILNTSLTLGNFFPDTDSTLWIEQDANKLIHLRMSMHVTEYQVSQIFTGIPYPTPTGFPFPADSIQIRSDQFKLKVYSNMFAGHLFFRDPRINLKFTNQIPIVTYFRLDTLTFLTGNGSTLSNTQVKSYTIQAPISAGQTAVTNITIDKNTVSILPDVFSPIPKFVSFAVTIGSQGTQTAAFSMTGNEKIKVDADIDLPVDARLEDLVMADTIPFKWETGTYSEIKSATLKLFLNNGFPADASTQVYFADTTNTGGIGNLVDSVFTDLTDPNITTHGWHLKSAQTDAVGQVTIPSVCRLLVTLDHARIENLKQHHAAKMIITATLNSYNSSTGQYVKMYSFYKIGIKAGIKADYSFDTNDTLINGNKSRKIKN
jgi:hypothetical protein